MILMRILHNRFVTVIRKHFIVNKVDSPKQLNDAVEFLCIRSWLLLYIVF